MATESYDNIERPYGPHLERQSDNLIPDTEIDSIASSGSGVQEESAATPVKSEQSINNLWIDSWIKSKNWSPKTRGFYLDGETGYAEFSNIYIADTLSVLTSGTIGGWTITSDELVSGNVKIQSVAERILMGSATAPNTGTGIFMGSDAGVYEFRVGNPASSYVWWDGTSLNVNGAVVNNLAQGSSPAIMGWQFSATFSATDYDTVAWTSGTITLPTGTTYAINSGNTGNMLATTYIYLDTTISETTLQTTTTASDAVGFSRILLGVAKNNADTSKKATFQIFGGTGGVSTLITADQIAAGTITADEIATNTITANEIDTNTITSLDLTSGTITGALIQTSTSGDRVVIDDTTYSISIYDTASELRMKLLHDELIFYNASGTEIGVFGAGIMGASQILDINLTSGLTGRGLVVYDNSTPIFSVSTTGVQCYQELQMYDHIAFQGAYDITGVDDIFMRSTSSYIHMNSGEIDELQRITFNYTNSKITAVSSGVLQYDANTDHNFYKGGVIKAIIDNNFWTAGDLMAGGSKPFIVDHPDGSGRLLRYTAQESPEVLLRHRGVAETDSLNKVTITPPNHFTLMTESGGLVTVNLTPIGDNRVFLEAEPTNSEILVGSSSPNVKFHYEIIAVRSGYLNAPVELDEKDNSLSQEDKTLTADLKKAKGKGL